MADSLRGSVPVRGETELTLTIVTSTAEIGGAEAIDLATLEALADDGIAMRAAVPRAGPLAARLEELGARVDVVPAPPAVDRFSRRYGGGGLRAAAMVSVYEQRLLRWLLRSRPRGLLALGFRAQLAVTPLAAAARIPVAWVAADLMPRGTPVALWSALARRIPKIVLTYSAAAASQPSLRGAPTVIVRPGIDLGRFPAGPGADGRDRLLVLVGHLTPLKNHLGFLEVVRLVRKRHPEARGILVGRDIYRTGDHDRYVRLVREAVASFSPRGAVELDEAADVSALLRRAAMLVHISSAPESFGLVAVEAMASGCPVVGFAHGALPEIVGDAGILVKPGDLAAAADACSGLLDSLLDAEFGRLGRARAERLFRREMYAHTTATKLRQALDL
jgi:glycosyltransferase involved in cell wall biosynthesis